MKNKIHSIVITLLAAAALSATAQTQPGTTGTTNPSSTTGSGTTTTSTTGANAQGATNAGKDKDRNVTSSNQAEIFRKLDTNGDGSLSQEEFARIATMSKDKGADKNGSGTSGASTDSERRPQ